MDLRLINVTNNPDSVNVSLELADISVMSAHVAILEMLPTVRHAVNASIIGT